MPAPRATSSKERTTTSKSRRPSGGAGKKTEKVTPFTSQPGLWRRRRGPSGEGRRNCPYRTRRHGVGQQRRRPQRRPLAAKRARTPWQARLAHTGQSLGGRAGRGGQAKWRKRSAVRQARGPEEFAQAGGRPRCRQRQNQRRGLGGGVSRGKAAEEEHRRQEEREEETNLENSDGFDLNENEDEGPTEVRESRACDADARPGVRSNPDEELSRAEGRRPNDVTSAEPCGTPRRQEPTTPQEEEHDTPPDTQHVHRGWYAPRSAGTATTKSLTATEPYTDPRRVAGDDAWERRSHGRQHRGMQETREATPNEGHATRSDIAEESRVATPRTPVEDDNVDKRGRSTRPLQTREQAQEVSRPTDDDRAAQRLQTVPSCGGEEDLGQGDPQRGWRRPTSLQSHTLRDATRRRQRRDQPHGEEPRSRLRR